MADVSVNVQTPEGFEPLPGPPPASAWRVPRAEGPIVLVEAGPDHGGDAVVVMTGRTHMAERLWPTRPQGDNVHVVALDPSREWTVFVDGEPRRLEVDALGRAWLFARGPRAWVALDSRPRRPPLDGPAGLDV